MAAVFAPQRVIARWYSSKWLANAAPSVLVAFLGQHDLVDEPAAERISGGQPRDFDAAEPPLQGLEQGHEIPHGEDVVFHEQTQRIQPVDFLVNGMVQQVRPFAARGVHECVEVDSLWHSLSSRSIFADSRRDPDCASEYLRDRGRSQPYCDSCREEPCPRRMSFFLPVILT